MTHSTVDVNGVQYHDLRRLHLFMCIKLGCAGSLLLPRLSPAAVSRGCLSGSVCASHRGGFSRCRARALDAQAS